MTFMKTMPALAIAVLIAGCGGGGGGGAVDTPSSATVQGDAIKGPMIKAKISLYKITADGKQGDLLQETTSDDKGHYSVTVNGYSGVVMAIASVVPGLTKMYDEATGLLIIPTASFKLRASFPVESGKTHSAQINPFTDLATATALAKSGGLSATNVEQANAGLAAALSFNPLTEAPAFEAGKPSNRAAVVLAAVSQIALSGKLGCATGDQAAKVACVTNVLSTTGLDSAFRTELQTRINLLVDAAGMDKITINDASGTPVTAPAATPLEQTKFFMGALRSNAKALDAADLSLQTELQKVADDMQNRAEPLAESAVTALDIAYRGAKFWNDVIKGDAPFVAGQNFYSGYETLGSCGFYSDTDYMVRATSKADAKYVACGAATESIPATNVNGGYAWCSAVGEWCDTQWSYRVRLHPDATDPNKFTIYTQTRESKRTVATVSSVPGGQPYPLTYTVTKKEYGAHFPGNAAILVTQKDSNGQITALNLAGELSPAFSITGPSYSGMPMMGGTYYLPGAVASVLGDKHNVTLSAALTKVVDLNKLALSGSVELIKAGALESRIELAAGSYLQSRLDAAGQAVQDGSQEMLIKLKGGTTGSTFTGDLKIGSFKTDASGTRYIPTLVAFNGSVQRNGVAFFEGSLTGEALNYAAFNNQLPRSTSNVETLRAGFVGKVSVPNRPVLNVNLSLTNNDKGSSASSATLSGQYVQGLLTLNVSGTSSAGSNTLTLETPSGIKLVIDKSQTTYPLTKGGDKMGEYSTLNHRLTYADSSYEQF